jgi:hypothetical protein
MFEANWKGFLLVRQRGTEGDHTTFSTETVQWADVHAAWEGFSSRRSSDRIYLMTFVDRQRKRNPQAFMLTPTVSIPQRTGKSTLRRMVYEIFAPAGPVLRKTLRETIEVFLRGVSVRTGNALARPAYDEWTRILHLELGCHLLLIPDRRDFEASLEDLVGRPYRSIPGAADHVMKVDSDLLKFLSGPIAQLREHLDSPI